MVFGKRRRKIKVILVKPLGKENYEKMGETKANIREDIVSYKDKTFPITNKCYFYINKGEPHIFIDYENEKILTINNKDIGINAKFLDKFLTTSRRGIIGQLLATLKSEMQPTQEWKAWIKPTIAFLLGAVIGYLVNAPA